MSGRKSWPALMMMGALISSAPAVRAAEPTLKVVALDVEGGGATLFVTPEGKSLLIDVGWPEGAGVLVPTQGPRNTAERIVMAAKALGVSKIDYLIITHYHKDHIGGIHDLLARFPIGVVMDHGPNRQEPPKNATPEQLTQAPATFYADYIKAIKDHEHVELKPGQVIRIGSMTNTIVASDGELLDKPLRGAGAVNPACDDPAGLVKKGGGGDNNENTRSVASLLRFGKVTIASFGDLSWAKEHDLVCPVDKVGHVNLLLVTQHGSDISSNPADIAAMKPDVAIMENGGAKGGDPDPIKLITASPGLQGFWRLHESFKHPEISGDKDYVANLSTPEAIAAAQTFTASNAPPDAGYAIRAEITKSGVITVTNDRNGFSKTYRVK